MKRIGALAIAVALALSVGVASGCQRTVEVKSGTRVVCTYGETISSDVKTIRVPADKAASYRVRTITKTCPTHLKLEALYAEAQRALVAGDVKTADAKLAQVVSVDPGFKQASQQRKTIAEGGKPKPDTSGAGSVPATTTPPATGDSGGGALTKWTPDVLSGFTAKPAGVDPLSVSRDYIAPASSPVLTLVLVAEQFRTADDAKKALTVEVKNAYPDDSATFTVKGHTVYFGTDGTRFAAVGFTDGAVMVAAEASPRSGAPKTMRTLLEQVVGQLP